MPARLSSMEPSSPEVDAQAPADTTAAGSRRKSGRVTKKPETIYSSAPAPSKRKRNEADEGDDDEGADADNALVEEEEDEESSEDEPDEEEIREKRRKKVAARKNKPQKKPAAKKSKPNGELSLAIRPAGKQKKAKKPRPSKIAAAEEVGGLYADVFASGDNLNDVAARWLHRFNDHNSRELAELINFVLRCAGCDSKVDDHDMEDPDNCDSKLNDIQEEYQAQNNVDYPLIAKGRGTANFRHNMVGFFSSLVETLAESEMMYNSPEIMENIHIWLSTMSSGKSRPFRHTATAISTAIISALCEVGKKLVEKNSRAIRQRESEARRNKNNKGRVAELDQKSKQAIEQQEKLEAIIRDWFDTVFVHRYRDVDPKIRLECVQGLSDWINTFPDLFFDGNHIRYLGWVLSDVSAATRLEVVKQLQGMFKDSDKLGGLKTFTERFRPRMVEMATQDADPSVRAATVELLHILLDVGLLEPSDIDSIGRLIFDVEPRVRKAVVGFVASNIEVVYDANVDELGGQEALDEALVTVDNDDDYENPRLEWLRLKSLVENLQVYDESDESLPSQIDRFVNSHVMVAAGVESRIQIAAEALYDTLPELQKWEVIAGYLLYDHSQSSGGAQTNGATEDPESAFKLLCKLTEKDEIILLDILNASVKMRLTHTMEAGKPHNQKSKLTKAQKESLQDEQEVAARHLAVLIPQLLNKFGAVPDAASAVLRLEHVLNLEVFQELRQDSTTYSQLLDDINKQFMSHGNEAVLVEASRALLHAKSYEELGEITEGKLQVLWEDTVAALHALHKGKPLSQRGNLSDNVLSAVSNTVLRISKLASISDCVEPLEAPPAITPKKTKRNSSQPAEASDAIAILIDLVRRGVPSSDTSTAQSATEDVIAVNAAQSLMFYFLWKIRYWEVLVKDTSIGSVPDDDVEAIAIRRDAFNSALEEVLRERQGADEVRLTAAGITLDLFTAFSSLRSARAARDEKREIERQKRENAQTNGNGDHAAGQQDENQDTDDFLALVLKVPAPKQKSLLQVLGAAERAFAKKAGKSLIGPAEDDEPADIEDEPESSDDEESDEEDESEQRQMIKAGEALLAEQRLCELAAKFVLAIVAGVLDGKPSKNGLDNEWTDEDEMGEAGYNSTGPIRRRLERNKNRLGNNFKEVVAYLEADHGEKSKKSSAASKGRAKSRATSSAPPNAGRGGSTKQQAAAKSAEMVVSEDEDDEEAEREREEEETRQRELEVHEDEEMADDGPEGEGEGEGEQESVLGD
ncbi:hypothetical protein IWX49DRAFT_178077 [Phyllosticta citricarpa]|uniref:SCD domain-containing protein n=2 Tax=Phyllosticta TaxID=121621 RepID=A0ABR1M484_9PEZI